MHPEFKTPKQHLDILLYPEREQIFSDLNANHTILSGLSGSSIHVLSKPFCDWRIQCRSELLQAVKNYSGNKGMPVPVVTEETSFIVTGHQCEFFHPGILSKYILADGLARNQGGIVFNLAVDSDLPKHIDFQVPVETESGIQVERIPFADIRDELPMEYQSPLSTEQVEILIRRLNALPVSKKLRDRIDNLCEYLRQGFGDADNLGEMIMRLNHRLACEFGIEWLDVPVSAMSETRCFSAFAVDLIINAVEVRWHYNQSLGDYRREHKIKNPLQPMGDLVGGDLPGEQQETLFWVFRKDQHRVPLYVYRGQDEIVMSDGQNDIVAFSYSNDMNSEEIIDSLLKVQGQYGFSLRPRAIALTLFARLFFADIFIHGIGGARYDVITDVLMEKLYHIDSPAYAIASATCYLQPADTVDAEVVRRIEHQLRDLRYHSLSVIDLYPEILKADEHKRLEEIVREKESCIAESRRLKTTTSDQAGRQRVFAEIHQLNDAIAALLKPVKDHLEREKERLQDRIRGAEVQNDREAFFGLFDEEAIKKLKQKFDISSR